GVNRDHPERDDAFPHGSRHGDAVYLPLPWLATFGGLGHAPTSRRSITSIDAPNPTMMIAIIVRRAVRSIPLDSGMPKSLNAEMSWTQAGHLKIGPTSATR